MGNQNTTSLSDKNVGYVTNTTDLKQENIKDQHDMCSLLHDSSKDLKGTKSGNLTTTDNNDISISNDTTSVVTVTNKETKQEACDGKVPTMFQWKEGGNVVYVSGSFSNWTHLFIMEKKENGIFELVLDLSRGVYQYKFIVDNQWKYSLLQPTHKDSKGNVNNIIQTSPCEKEKLETYVNIEEKIVIPDSNKKNLTDEYTQYIPLKNDLNMDAPNVPYHYSIPFNLDFNTHQCQIGNNECINIKERNNYNANNSNKNILNTPHVNL